MDKILSVIEAAEELGVSREAVYAAIRENRLPSVNILGKIGIERSALEKYRPNEQKMRAGKERSTAHHLVACVNPVDLPTRSGEMYINLDEIKRAEYRVYPTDGGDEHILELIFVSGERTNVIGETCHNVLDHLRQRVKLININLASKGHVFNPAYIEYIIYQKKQKDDRASLVIRIRGERDSFKFFGNEAEAIWKEIKPSLNVLDAIPKPVDK